MIKRLITRSKIKWENLLGLDYTGRLNTYQKNINKNPPKTESKKIKILIGPSFAIWGASYIIDKSLALALQIKGVEVVPIYCDSIQHVECNFIGGEWGNFSRDCKNCKKTSENLWQNNPNKPLKFSEYLDGTDIEKINSEVSALSLEQSLAYNKLNIPFGSIAKDILVNNYLVATLTLIKNHEFLLKEHLKNLLMLNIVYENILDEQKPDRVISNDSFYGMWKVLQFHCQRRDIPFYSHWAVTKNRAAFAYNDAAMNLDLKKSWFNFSKISLTDEDDVRINKWLTGDRGLVLDITKLGGHEHIDIPINTIDPDKLTIILAANVIWDLAALNKQILFSDMNEWITETIGWFAEKDDIQLIIRPHPLETSPIIPNTKETVAEIIASKGIKLTENVILLKPDVKMTFQELMNKCNVRGILVHTATVGFEYACIGLPVITTAKSPYRGFGFTIDPVNRGDYFSQIESLLASNAKKVSDTDIILARKFVKFYQFHYYSDIGLYDDYPSRLSEDFMDNLTREDGAFNYVVNSMIEGRAINDEIRWLPET